MPVTAGSTNLFFARDTRVFLEQGTNIWELPVLNGFAYSQAMNTSEVTLNEMADTAGNSRRGRRVFNDSQAPAEWSFDTYVRPYYAASTVRAVEEALWANFVANNSYVPATPAWNAGVTIGTTELDFDFADSNKTTLGVFNLYFVLGGSTVSTVGNGYSFLADGDTTIYRVSSCSVNEVAINFDIDGIATLSWSGMGSTLREVTSLDATGAIVGGIASTKNFIRNRLTSLAITGIAPTAKTYDITLTGGSITLTNNLSYLTPEVLGRVNTPLGHVTGTRSIGGTFTCYIDEKTNGSLDLFEDISQFTSINNVFSLDFYVGGKSGTDAPVAPGLQFKIPKAQLEIPSHSIDDVIALDVNFAALPTTISDADEITRIRYVNDAANT